MDSAFILRRSVPRFTTVFRCLARLGGWVEVTPIDISLTDILVETEEYVGTQNTRTSVKLALDAKTAQLPSVVVRRDPLRVAFQFTESAKNEEIDPPHNLIAIYRTLEMLKARRE